MIIFSEDAKKIILKILIENFGGNARRKDFLDYIEDILIAKNLLDDDLYRDIVDDLDRATRHLRNDNLLSPTKHNWGTWSVTPEGRLYFYLVRILQ